MPMHQSFAHVLKTLNEFSVRAKLVLALHKPSDAHAASPLKHRGTEMTTVSPSFWSRLNAKHQVPRSSTIKWQVKSGLISKERAMEHCMVPAEITR